MFADLRNGVRSSTVPLWQNLPTLSGAVATYTSGVLLAATALASAASSLPDTNVTVSQEYLACSRFSAARYAFTSGASVLNVQTVMVVLACAAPGEIALVASG